MKMFYCVVAMLFVPVVSPSQSEAPLKLEQTIPLPGLKEGDFDHFAVDLVGHRLFLTAEANEAVYVFDIQTNKLVHTIAGLKAPHALLFRRDVKKMYVVDGDASEIKVYDSDKYTLLKQISLTIDADSIAFDAATQFLYVVNGGREAHTPYSLISVVDTNSDKKLTDIKINSKWVEAMAVEKAGSRLFCNITSENAVGVIDRKKNSLIATWPLPADAKENLPLFFHEANHRLFVVTRKPPKLIILDSDNGKAVASLPTVGIADELAYDAKNKRIYVAGDQFVDVFKQQDADHYTHLGRVPGGFRAKTAILVPALGRYYLAVPRHGSQPAAVKVFAVMP